MVWFWARTPASCSSIVSMRSPKSMFELCGLWDIVGGHGDSGAVSREEVSLCEEVSPTPKLPMMVLAWVSGWLMREYSAVRATYDAEFQELIRRSERLQGNPKLILSNTKYINAHLAGKSKENTLRIPAWPTLLIYCSIDNGVRGQWNEQGSE